MRHPLSLSTRRELLAGTSKRYVAACSIDRRLILDEFVCNTGYNRNYAVHLLLHPPTLPAATRGRRPRVKAYGPPVRMALETIWRVAGGICGKRLVPILPELIDALERHGEIDLCPNVRSRLLTISAATCDRLLTKARAEHPHGLCTTRPTPHLLLRSQIPVRTFADWNEAAPGFLEVDLVAHCGETTRGEHLFTLTAVDVHTGWTCCVAIPNKSQISITRAMDKLRSQMPFPLLGIDTDNGGEFINHNLVRYCAANAITMTRCRPYKKNDQCHVEQKNGNVVRAVAGYSRYEGSEPLAVLAKLYTLLADYQSFFQPSMKLIVKSRDKAKVTKIYDKATTPYQRLGACVQVTPEAKARLQARYFKLNPAALQRGIHKLRQQLRILAVDYNPAVDNLASLYGLTQERS